LYIYTYGDQLLTEMMKSSGRLFCLISKRDICLFEVNTFSRGGNVEVAMRIGNQIRTLQARTMAPNHFINEPGFAQCWFVASASHGGVGYHPNTNYKRNLRTSAGASWCDCASACFLIWASGVTREGNFVGVHRFRFDEMYFGSLSPSEAKMKYAEAETVFRSYLAKLNVSASGSNLTLGARGGLRR
jgi:hypothetical protein